MRRSTSPPPPEPRRHAPRTSCLPLRARRGAPRIFVAIPAKDEEHDIGRALSALAEAARGMRCEVVVLANDCRDATAAVARSHGRQGRDARRGDAPGFGVHAIECRLPPGRANAGHARRLAMDAAVALCAPGDLLMTSDADAAVTPGTLQAVAAALARADLVCGGISTTLPEAVASAASIRRIDGASEPARALVHEVRFAIDRLFGAQPEGACPHYVESGACLALTPDLYRRLGGLPDVASSEDRALVRAAEAAGARVAYAGAAHAWVSARLDGRAAGGMAEAIRTRLADPDPQADQSLIGVDALEAHWRHALALLAAGAPRPDPPEASPPLRASDLERELPRLRAFVEGVVRPGVQARSETLAPGAPLAAGAAAGRQVA